MIYDAGEIYRRYKNMRGEEIHKITILSELNDCSARQIKQIIAQEKEKETILTAECSGEYHPDDNPYCKAKVEAEEKVTQESISNWITNMIFASIETLEVEIRGLEKQLEAKREEYNKLVNLL
jgi:hypothetical protein